MIKPVDNIVIVGGGSAGWITAAMIIKQFPQKSVTVIESPDVPTVGVGESTLGQFKQMCEFLEIDEPEFMRRTDASYKLSIKFNDFYEKNDGGFHYPFGLPFEDNTITGVNDWFYKKIFYPETPVTDYVDSFFPVAALFDKNKFSTNSNGELDNYNPLWNAAYHFDATKFAIWLRDQYCIPRGVHHIQATVVDADVDSEVGIQKLFLSDGKEITANLFVDCTGFRSLLIGDYMKQEFKSYDHILPNNRAWACQVPYKDKEKEMQVFTNCTAIENGWVWNTPIWTRIGTGYVYSDKFVDPETAKEEFKRYLMSDKMVIPRTKEEVDQLKFRDLKMRIGTYKKTFVKNVVAIGLSAGFIEPLESNGLLTIHEWTFYLLRLLTRPAINQYDKDSYNKVVFEHWENFADFVAKHYALSIRNDTEYWRSNFNRSIIDLNEKHGCNNQWASETISLRFSKKIIPPQNINGINWISTGMNWFINDHALYSYLEEPHEKSRNNKKREDLERVFRILEKRKLKWRKHAEKCPSLYEFQKNNIHFED
jgi:tryptophan halogenase